MFAQPRQGRDLPPATIKTLVTQERTASPSTWTVQAPHCESPQPKCGLDMPVVARRGIEQRHIRIGIDIVLVAVHLQGNFGHGSFPVGAPWRRPALAATLTLEGRFVAPSGSTLRCRPEPQEIVINPCQTNQSRVSRRIAAQRPGYWQLSKQQAALGIGPRRASIQKKAASRAPRVTGATRCTLVRVEHHIAGRELGRRVPKPSSTISSPPS